MENDRDIKPKLRHRQALYSDVNEICKCIDTLAGLAGIHKINMARILCRGMVYNEIMLGQVEFLKAIKRMTGEK